MSTLTFPGLVKTGLAACLAVGIAHRTYADLVCRKGHPGFEQHSLRCGTSGNIVTYHLRRGTPGGPTLVCEAGLMSTSLVWLLIAERLDPSITVVLYDRAGYHSSLRRCPEDYSLNESVSVLVELVAAVSSDGPCVLTGHSLGGYLVHRAAAATDQVHGLVLIDPTHPRELQNSRRQREGAKALNLSMKLGPMTVAFGGGLLMDKRKLFGYAADSPYYQALLIESSAGSTWRTGRREWDYTYAFMLDGGRPLDQLGIPVSLVAAEATMESTPEHGDLYEEYIASGTGGEIVTVPDSSHLSITSGVTQAPATAAEIEKAVAAAVEKYGNGDQARQEKAA